MSSARTPAPRSTLARSPSGGCCETGTAPPQPTAHPLTPHNEQKILPRMITDVVPSPTSSSCVRLSSIMLFAAGCETSTSRRMLLPSFVSRIPPIGSRSIFSMERGPNVVRMMSATAYAQRHPLQPPSQLECCPAGPSDRFHALCSDLSITIRPFTST